jgi:hypothetical protein
MNRFIRKSLWAVCTVLTLTATVFSQSQDHGAKIARTYDSEKDKTTVRMSPVKISGDKDKYRSLHISPSFSYTGPQPQTPSTIDFELQTVVKGNLRKDLYVVFIVDGETIFLSSNRWGIKRPVAGRRWMGERLVFNMPYETLLKIAAAKSVEIKMGAVSFALGEEQMQAIRDFSKHIQSTNGSSFRTKSDPRITRKSTNKSHACFHGSFDPRERPFSCCFVYFVDRFLFPNKGVTSLHSASSLSPQTSQSPGAFAQAAGGSPGMPSSSVFV